jgi:hypothetical protein
LVSAATASVAKPPIDVVLVNPVPDLSRVGSDPRVKTRSTQDFLLGAVEYSVPEVLPQIELPSYTTEEFNLGLQVLALVPGPGHPWTEVFQTGIDGDLQRCRVRGLPAAKNETLRVNPVRRPSSIESFS